jgi:hypothetical protein
MQHDHYQNHIAELVNDAEIALETVQAKVAEGLGLAVVQSHDDDVADLKAMLERVDEIRDRLVHVYDVPGAIG